MTTTTDLTDPTIDTERLDRAEADLGEFKAWLAATEARLIELIAEVRQIRAERSEVSA